MKRFFTAIMILYMICTVLVSSTAAVTQSQEIKARYVYSTDAYVIQAVSSTSTYSAEFAEFAVKVKLPAPKTGYSLIVRQVNESMSEAYDWFNESSAALNGYKLFLDIYFIDIKGNKVDLDDDAKVTVKFSKEKAVSSVYSLSTSAELTEIECDVQDTEVSFTIKSNGYYILSENAHSEYLLGDVNGDGKINTADAVVVLKCAAGMIQLDETQLLAADTSRDGKVNTADAVFILKYAAGMITEF